MVEEQFHSTVAHKIEISLQIEPTLQTFFFLKAFLNDVLRNRKNSIPSFLNDVLRNKRTAFLHGSELIPAI